MGYSDHIVKTWDKAILSSVLLELTYRCNLDCVICYNDRAQTGIALTREQYVRLLDDLAALQVLTLILSGGEPLLHPDFWAIGTHARTNGFVVRIKSNGHALGPTAARRLKREIDPYVIELSLHGATAATHDRQTRTPGSFARLMNNIRALQNAGLRVKCNSPLTAWSEDEVEAMFALAESLCLPLAVDNRLTPKDDGDLSPLDIGVSDAGLRRVFGLQRAAGEQRRSMAAGRAEGSAPSESCRHCGAGASTLAIDPYGNVLPCVQWRRPIGSLHERSITDLWQDSPELERVRAITMAVKARFAAWPEAERPAGFCPALAEQRTGSPMELDPEMLRLREALAAANP